LILKHNIPQLALAWIRECVFNLVSDQLFLVPLSCGSALDAQQLHCNQIEIFRRMNPDYLKGFRATPISWFFSDFYG
jgi:hypothetical protein